MASLIVSPTNRRQIENVVCCIKFRYSCNSVTEDDLSDIYNKLQGVIKSPYINLADASISLLSKQLKLDSENTIIKHPELIKAIVKHFNRLAESLKQQNNQPIHCIMLNILSILTQIIHTNPSLEMPFNRSFIQNLFMINTSLLENSLRKKDILRVMSVIFYDLSRRLCSLKQLGLVNRFRQILLQSFKIIEEGNTFVRFYKSLCKVCLLIPLAMKEIVRYRVMETYMKFCCQEKTKILEGLQVKKSEVDSIIVDPNLANGAKLSQT